MKEDVQERENNTSATAINKQVQEYSRSLALTIKKKIVVIRKGGGVMKRGGEIKEKNHQLLKIEASQQHLCDHIW